MKPLADLPPAALEQVAQYFRVLSEPTRLRILNVLGSGPMSVGDIAEQIDSSVANASRHLALMARHGLISRESHGSSVHYALADETVQELCELVCGSIARRFDRTAGARAAFGESAHARPARKHRY